MVSLFQSNRLIEAKRQIMLLFAWSLFPWSPRLAVRSAHTPAFWHRLKSESEGNLDRVHFLLFWLRCDLFSSISGPGKAVDSSKECRSSLNFPWSNRRRHLLSVWICPDRYAFFEALVPRYDPSAQHLFYFVGPLFNSIPPINYDTSMSLTPSTILSNMISTPLMNLFTYSDLFFVHNPGDLVSQIRRLYEKENKEVRVGEKSTKSS